MKATSGAGATGPGGSGPKTNSSSLTPDMKATVALITAWIVYLVADVTASVLLGTVEFYAVASLIVVAPYLLLLYFCWKGKAWAFLVSSAASVLVVAAVPFTITKGISSVDLYFAALATTLGALTAVEGFKAYVEAMTHQHLDSSTEVLPRTAA